MESSIAEFVERQLACELLPTENVFFGLAEGFGFVNSIKLDFRVCGFWQVCWTGSTRFVFVSCKHEPARSVWQSPLANARCVAYSALATCRPDVVICTLVHTFSAFWLWSSVVSVLISVTTDMSPTGDLLVTSIFAGEVSSWARSEAFTCCAGIAPSQWQHTLLG